MILTGPYAEDLRPDGFNYGVAYFGERFRNYDAFVERANEVCEEVCSGRWIPDYFHIHLENEEDELLVALSL